MTFRLRRVETSADGRRIVRDQDLASASVSIGRAAGNDLHLPDLSLDPSHATIALEADGRVAVTAVGTLGFMLDGRTTRAGEIDPALGGELRFGRYRLTVGQEADGAVLLTLEEVAAAPQAGSGEGGFSLSGLVPGKRAMSWFLAVAILITFLAVPIVSNLTRERAVPVAKAGRTDRILGDGAWSTGPLSLAHSTLANQCEACHVKPFEAVRDQTCRTCHEEVSDHASHPHLTLARGPDPLGEKLLWKVAHAFGKPGPGACSDCHTEHEGAVRMPPPPQAFCADCHDGLRSRLPGTGLGDAADFARHHPSFRPAVPLDPGSAKVTRVSLAANPREASGLTFPHRLHLDPRGGVAQMATRIGGERGYGADGLICKDCHRANADGVRFAPIDMERDCGTCHSLAYDRVDGRVRRLRHGDVEQMIADLSVAPASSRALVGGRNRPGAYSNSGPYRAAFAPAAGGLGLPAVALSRDGICGECHTPSAGQGRLAVLPVTQVERFMAHGWFSHRAHRQAECSTCHAAERSETSADLLLPDLATCRTCHGGEQARAPKIPSTCAMCHDYHPDAQAPRGILPVRKD
jgi:hypothetical protein